ncbi:MAG: ROK family transcriptional regulator [Burkholderiaceae bacterium]
MHRSLALRRVFGEPGISRGDLADRLGLSQMAIGRIVRELEAAGLVRESSGGALPQGRGRPASSLELRADGAYAAGALLSAYAQEVAIVDLRGALVASRQIEIDDLADGEHAVDRACDAVRALIGELGLDAARVAGVGFSVAVNVDPSRGAVLGGGYLGWRAFDLRARVAGRLGLPVSLERVADALLRAETFCGCAAQARAVVLVHAATTLGLSVWFDGTLMRGAGFHAGRIGHFPIRPTRLICSCGQSDCLNCLASGWSVLARLQTGVGSVYSPARVQEYARAIHGLIESPAADGTQAARRRRLLGEAGVALARGLTYVDLAFDPDVVILAGSLARNDSYFRGVLRGLQRGGGAGADLALKTNRGAMLAGRSAALIGLLDHVLSPTLALHALRDEPAVERRHMVHDDD